jgi:PhzF family phenazine biosynthesis protein
MRWSNMDNSVKVFVYDSFYNGPGTGNRAGVLSLEQWLTNGLMQAVANKLGYSETAYIKLVEKNIFEIKFFTPMCEVDFCGHAALAAGKHILTHYGLGEITFQAKDGVHVCNSFEGNLWLKMSPPKHCPADIKLPDILEALDISPSDLYDMPKVCESGLRDLIVGLKKTETLHGLNPRMERVAVLSEQMGITGIHVISVEELENKQIYARNFAPLVGINEEAATGTSNASMIEFLRSVVDSSLINGVFTIYQGPDKNRLSRIYVSINDDNLVKIGGDCRQVFINSLLI